MSKSNVPKKILGWRVPKRVRRSRAAQALATRMGQDIIEDLIAAAILASLAQLAKDDSAVRRRLRRAPEVQARLAGAFGAAAETFVEALRHGPEPARA